MSHVIRQVRSPSAPALDPQACVFRHVARTARAVAAAYDAGLNETGLSAHQFNVLMTLRQAGRVTVGELAALAGMDPSTVPRASASLVARGWVSVAAGTDRRRRYLELTATGRKKIDAAETQWRTIQSAVLSDFGAADWVALTKKLKALTAAASAANPR